MAKFERFLLVQPDKKSTEPISSDSKVVAPMPLMKKLSSRSSAGRSSRQMAGSSKQLNTIHSTVLRFIASGAAVNSVITPKSVLGALGGICTVANTTVTPFCSAFRIKRIRCAAASGGECTVAWAMNPGNQMRDDVIDATMPTGITVLEQVSAVPPKLSFADMWQSVLSTGTNQLLSISATSGSVLDLELDFQLADSLAPTSVAVATGSLGAVYYLYLDAPTAHIWKQLGRPTTF